MPVKEKAHYMLFAAGFTSPALYFRHFLLTYLHAISQLSFASGCNDTAEWRKGGPESDISSPPCGQCRVVRDTWHRKQWVHVPHITSVISLSFLILTFMVYVVYFFWVFSLFSRYFRYFPLPHIYFFSYSVSGSFIIFLPLISFHYRNIYFLYTFLYSSFVCW